MSNKAIALAKLWLTPKLRTSDTKWPQANCDPKDKPLEKDHIRQKERKKMKACPRTPTKTQLKLKGPDKCWLDVVNLKNRSLDLTCLAYLRAFIHTLIHIGMHAFHSNSSKFSSIIKF